MNLEALYNAVIVKPIEDTETVYGSIVVPDAGKDRNEKGEVVAVGPGKESPLGEKFFPTVVKIGEIVILPTMGFTKLEYKGEEYYIGPEDRILARIKNDNNKNEK